MTVTSSEFLDSVKRAVTLPANQVRFTDEDLLRFADEETQSTILPVLLSIRQEFLVKSASVAIEANKSEYKIPYRAVGRTLRDIKVIDSNGTWVRDLPFVMPEHSQRFTSGYGGDPAAFTVRGEYIVLLPTPTSATNQLQMFYELMPSNLVEASDTGTIASVDYTTGIVTVDTAVAGFATGQGMDIIDGRTGNSVLAEGITNTNVATTAITFDPDDLPAGIVAGDYLAIANQSPVVQLPQELVQSLVLAVACRIVEALGDYEGLRASQEKLKMKLDAAQQLLSPRVESQVPVVSAHNGLLRRSGRYNRWFR